MGGAVSSGESNDDLVDNLLSADYIKSPDVESVFRAVDRGFYFTKEHRASAYKDLAWKDGNLHISAPCIYTEVMENLRVKPGMSFLNVGSGTGYFSTVVGLLLGRTGVNHGIEIHEDVVQYARVKLAVFLHSSPAIDLFDFAPPEFIVGNICEVMPGNSQRYDRIYCGAACSKEEAQLIVNLLKIGGIAIIPLNDSLVQITRSSTSKIETKTLLSVSFASLLPGISDPVTKNASALPGWNARGLKDLCRAEIRDILRKTLPAAPCIKEIRKRKVFRRRKQRQANRLLLVQRRRRDHRPANEPFFEFSPDVEVDSSSEEEESARCRSPSAPSSVPASTCTTNSKEPDTEPTTAQDSGTESGERRSSLPYGARCGGKMPPTPITVTVDSAPDSPEAGCSGHPNVESGSRAGKRCSGLEGAETSCRAHDSSASLSEPQVRSEDQPPRQLRTVRILERIREIIRRRQQQRLAQTPPTNAPDLSAEFDALEAAIDEPANGDAAEQHEDDMDFDCLWSTTDDDTSSDSDSEAEHEGMVVGNEAEIEIGALGGDFPPVRRIRRVSVDPSSDDDDDSMDQHVLQHHIQFHPPPAPLSRSDGRSNIDIEIEVLEEELLTSVPLTHVTSVELKAKINLLPLPPSIKNFLNYGRV